MNSQMRSSPDWLKACALSAVAAILLVHGWLAWSGHPIYRDQHLGAALEYAANGVDLLRPIIVGFNANAAPTPLEFPLWQAATGLALRWGGGWWGWGNIVAWLVFVSCLPPFFLLARRLIGVRAAWWSVLVLCLQPLVFWQAGQAGTDGTALATMVWFVFAAERLLATRSWWWWLATVLTGIASATQKAPFYLAAGIGVAGLLASRKEWRGDATRWVQLILAGGVAIAVFAVWTRYAERQFAAAELPFIDLRVSANTGTREWYFGTWAQRLSFGFWLRGGYRALTGLFGCFPFVLLPLVALRSPAQALARAWLAGGIVATLVFTNLILEHWHYYLMFSPPIALLTGLSLTTCEEWFASASARRSGVVLAIVAALGLACAQGLRMGNFLLRDPFPRTVAAALSEHTTPADRILIVGGGWGGDELMRSHRRGLTLSSCAVLDSAATRARLHKLGFTKLALVSESPLRSAIAIVDGSETKRRLWRDSETATVREWTTEFANDDIAILQLPAPQGEK